MARTPTSTFNKRRNKFNACRTYSPLVKRTFDSAAEMRYGEYLFAREQNGEISDLQFQVTVQLCKAVRLRVDFKYFDKKLGETVWDEFKGFETPAWKTKCSVWAAGLGPGLLRVTYERKNKVEHWRWVEHWPAKEKP